MTGGLVPSHRFVSYFILARFVGLSIQHSAMAMIVAPSNVFTGDDSKTLHDFLGSMNAKTQSAGPGTDQFPKDQFLWFNEVEKSLGGSAHSLYIAERDNILAMRREYPERHAVLAVQYRCSQAP